jgi:NADPH:quinone reductase-like Zn-dependent oxidoreductase
VAAGKGPFGVVGRFVGSQVRRRLLRQRVANFIASGPFDENLLTLNELIEAGKITPAIERTYPLDQAPAAIAYAKSERVCGKLVISI